MNKILLIALAVLLTPTMCMAQLVAIPYDQAAEHSLRSGQSLLVFVESDACPPCIKMKAEVLEPMQLNGELYGLIVTTVKVGPITEKIGGASVTPTRIGYRRLDGQWKRYKMEGRQSIDRVRTFVKLLK